MDSGDDDDDDEDHHHHHHHHDTLTTTRRSRNSSRLGRRCTLHTGQAQRGAELRGDIHHLGNGALRDRLGPETGAGQQEGPLTWSSVDTLRFGSHSNVIYALPNEVNMLQKEKLKRPTRERIAGPVTRSSAAGTYAIRGLVNGLGAG
ncbi:hypothetical protein VMCG_10785 [Cytospora schulzeri]|uniref:Vacuolar import/degradation Vid27 C-terminal domain-containing protein n=1 Tax=Cytospora schulzeri TaxID=448051 RepID=A0A423V9C1_9PEZI|nr:hypothetical protein VMCG_10785 [Valsa malicola]